MRPNNGEESRDNLTRLGFSLIISDDCSSRGDDVVCDKRSETGIDDERSVTTGGVTVRRAPNNGEESRDNLARLGLFSDDFSSRNCVRLS